MKRWAVVVTVVTLLGALSGCGVHTSACVDWVFLDTPADQADMAELVIVGQRVGAAGTTERFGVDASAHMVRVDRVLKGELDDAEIRVISMPEGCSEDPHSNGDQVDTDGIAQYFLKRDQGSWQTITGYQGVEKVPADGTLPWDPAAPTPSPSS